MQQVLLSLAAVQQCEAVQTELALPGKPTGQLAASTNCGPQ